MQKYFEIAYKESLKSLKSNDVPVGAIIVKKGKVISLGHNKRVKNNDVMGHAEIIAINKATKRLKTYNLNDCEMYVTLKPCSMCMEIINSSKLGKVNYLIDKDIHKKEYKCQLEQTSVCNCLNNKYTELLSNFFIKFRGKS